MKYTYYGNESNTELINKDIYPNWTYDELEPDIVFSFGGDGTMLGCIHKYEHRLDKCKFVGIKKGNLGFFYGFDGKSLDDVVKDLEHNKLKDGFFNLLEYSIIGDEKIKGYAINEVAITNPIHTQIIDVYINNILFEEFRGTGFIACPPSGSTAYSKSMGGSVIDPTLEAFELVEIASINNRLYKTLTSPMIFGKNYQVRLKFATNKNIYVSVDGVYVKCDNLQEVILNISNKKVNILCADSFFERVKKAFID